MVVGLIHPGEMGATVGAAATAGGARVLWASEGRSQATRARVTKTSLEDAATLAALVETSDVVFSVCPPHASIDVAREVAALGFAGIFVDANAVSPETTRGAQAIVESAGAGFVDGGIIGPPAHSAGTTRLYLSGADAAKAASLFEGSLLKAQVIDGEAGAASALKMAYAAYTKGSSALLIAIRALASAEGIEVPLMEEWGISQPGLEARSEQAARNNAFKAWRFAGEMHEIADTFEAAGLPDGFHRAAAGIYERLERFKDCNPAPATGEVVAQVLKRE
jgi:3-hydroxyisobutyrate dehydrogenase-like beta-hydroxyacid dehydrogenase